MDYQYVLINKETKKVENLIENVSSVSGNMIVTPYGVYYYDPETQECCKFPANTFSRSIDLTTSEPITTYSPTSVTDTERKLQIPPMEGQEWDVTTQQFITTVAYVKEKKLKELNAIVDAYKDKAESMYSSMEIDSWSKQEAGAKALKADPNSTSDDANYVKKLAAIRGIDVTELVTRILNNVAQAEYLSVTIMGIEQALEDRVNAVDLTASDAMEQIEAITFPSNPFANVTK